MAYDSNFSRRVERRFDRNEENYSSYRRSGGVYRDPYRSRYNERPNKRSGAKAGNYVNGNGEQRPFVQGWMVRQRWLVSIICVPCNDAKTASPRSEKWVAKVSYNNGHKPETVTAFYNVETRKVTIPDLQIVLNPSAPNGGFCGSFFKRKNRR